ncbi:hypothetical protein BURKHO8Y_510039 [Burkholderia sp. 8Y]|nr:hypothetical protein BURKHO8Y_510039 [Burkholderia sp. 8Y]
MRPRKPPANPGDWPTDDLGYLPFAQTGGALLFYLLSKLFERTSVALKTASRMPLIQ